MARAASPELAYRIGQYFKENKVKNEIDGGNRPEEQSLQHLMTHAILGAATSYATGNDITSGALTGASSEYTAPILSAYLFGKDPQELTQEQKDTVTSIITLGTAGIAYGATGNVSSAVSASEVGKVGVENNTLKKSDADELLRQIAYARRHYDGAKLDEEMRRIRSLSAKLANENFKEIQACQNNPTPSCVNKIKAEYKDVNFAGLQDAYREYQGTHTILSGYESRNNSLLSCANTNFADCIIIADGEKVMLEGAYAAVGGYGVGKLNSAIPLSRARSNINNPNISFNANISKHMVDDGGFSQSKGISGTHNRLKFQKAAQKHNIQITDVKLGNKDGIYTIGYKIPSKDRKGDIVGYKNQIFYKTVYDPKKYSDAMMLRYGQEAAKQGYQRAISERLTQYDSTYNGITFRVYLDSKTGQVTNFHPK